MVLHLRLAQHNTVASRYPSKPPIGKLLYNPQRYCGFSEVGESLVMSMINNSPADYHRFNKLMSLERQREILREAFNSEKIKYLDTSLSCDQGILKEITTAENLERKLKDKKPTKNFFEKQWTWNSFVPPSYRRTLAPRISTSGGTLHAMKKEMSKEVLRLASMDLPDVTFIDIDLSACHANVAASLQRNEKSLLNQAVTNASQFWNDLSFDYTNILVSEGVEISTSSVRGMLKVSFYTSLNGGNPFNLPRLSSNLKINAPELLTRYSTCEEFGESSLFTILKNTLERLQIISEVKELNKICTLNQKTYTIDRRKPYTVDSEHKGISRVLQGVEVVLLSIMVSFLKERDCLPINLAHDGVLVAVKGDVDPDLVCKGLTEDISNWSRFLLRGLEIGVEPKISVKGGVVTKR